MAGIRNFEGATTVFAGQGDLVMFDKVADYSAATFATLANPVSLGQIVQDSTSWEGDDPETTVLKDEQGDIISAKVAAGTLGFSFDLASTSKAMVEKFLGGKTIESLGSNTNFGSVTAVGFGVDLPVITVPLMILNDEKNRCWLYPKSKVVSSLTYGDGIWKIHAVVTCEYLDLPTLKTGMIIEGAPLYDAGE